MTDQRPRVEFRPGNLEPELASRADAGMSLGLVALRDLERYYALLRDELAPLRDRLTEGEALLILDAMNGLMTEAHTYRLLWANVADAIRLDGLDRKWEVDGDRLVTLLQSISPGVTMALCDAVERAWNLVGQGDGRDMREIVRAVGLVKRGESAQ